MPDERLPLRGQSRDEPPSDLPDYVGDLLAYFIPDLEDDEWAWWPPGHDFLAEWDGGGALWEIAIDAAFRTPVNDLTREMLRRAVDAGEEGTRLLVSCEVPEPTLPFRLLIASEDDSLSDLEEAADVLAGCFELADQLGPEDDDERASIIGEELYGASDDWCLPLAWALAGLKLRRLGPEFQAAMAAWQEQIVTRARASYLAGGRG